MQDKTLSRPKYWHTVQCPGTDGASFAVPNCAHATGQTVFSPIQRSPLPCSLKTHRLRTQHQRLSLWTEADLTARHGYRQAGINQRATHKAVLGGKVLTCISCFSGKGIKHRLLCNFTEVYHPFIYSHSSADNFLCKKIFRSECKFWRAMRNQSQVFQVLQFILWLN